MTITTTSSTDTIESVVQADDHRAALYSLSTDELVDIAIKYIETVAARRERAIVRQRESAARAVPLPQSMPPKVSASKAGMEAAHSVAREAYKATILRKFKPLLADRIELGDGRSTTWGHATAADHKSRIEMLGRQSAGIAQTIDLHQDAIDAMRELGIISLEWLDR